MNNLRVWAPNARQVQIEIEGNCAPMTARADGWFEAEARNPQPNECYAFRLDGGRAIPDPRSAYQPFGVHGPSQRLDQAAFAWTDQLWRPPAFGPGSVLYELHPGTFSDQGTFDGALQHLDHLVTLGITHIEIMPVAAAPGKRGWGYDGVSLYAPHVEYGGPDGLKRLVDACHSKGLAVILDVVYNHLGPSGNYLGVYGPYFTNKYSTPWGDAVNFDGPDSDHVRRFFIDNALMWLRDYHVDGLRLDAVHAIVDTSATHFLEQLTNEVRSLECELGKRLVVIAESDLNDPRLVRSRELGGFGLDAMYSDDFHHALHSLLTSERDGYYKDFGELSQLAKALHHGVVYDGLYSQHRRRVHGRRFEAISGHQLVVSLQNHDQIGNRAKGDRIGHLVSGLKLKLGAAILLTSPFVPMLFQGEEWAASSPFAYFTDHQEPALAEAVRAGRRREFAAFGWAPEEIPDPQANETFIRSKLNWNERTQAEHAEIFEWYRRLIALRQALPELRDGRVGQVVLHIEERGRWLTLRRGRLFVACNFSDSSCKVPSDGDLTNVEMTISAPPVQTSGDSLTLPAHGVCLCVAQQSRLRTGVDQ
jgi:maltooligosyltrehalose trehalohydrolase